MKTLLTRRDVLASGFAAVALPLCHHTASAASSEQLPGIRYLEGIKSSVDAPYLPPSALHPAYSHAVYVNTALSGPAAQKMWVIERHAEGWRLAAHDAEHWEEQGEPIYSSPVSTGRVYPGDRRSGPTPKGVFNIDERPRRHRPGWGSAGMYNAIYIDLHYKSGRASGIALHGTPSQNYGKLGQADSHGCVRMRQGMADRLWAIIHPDGARGPASPLWGNVPRFSRSEVHEDMSARTAYVRDGSLLEGRDGDIIMRQGYRMALVFFGDAA